MPKKSCKNCDGKCCKYVVMEIDTPETKEDFENIRWFVVHKNVRVFVDEDDCWHIEFITPCEFLGKNNLCKIYSKRPKICREYSHDECLFHNDDYCEKYVFEGLKDIDSFLRKKQGD